MNMIVGAVGVSDYFGCVSPVYYTYYGGIDNSFTTKFYEYLFRCKTVQGVLYSLGKGLIAIDRGDGKYNTLRLKVSRDDLRSLRLPFPNQLEVTAIVNFLDHKTALIDQAIDIKQKQIELLKERRQILIHKAITRGLNPDVKMKDSGVEWIGEIPEHWEVFELKRLINPKRKITYGIVQPGEPDPHGRYMIRGQDYSKGWADRESLFRVSNKIEEPYKRARVIPGDIIITIVGAGCGNLEIIPDWLDGANLTQTTARVAIDQSAFWSKYFYYTLLSNVGISQMRLYIKGAAQPGLNLEHIKIYKLPTPLYQEQIEISNYIESIEVSFKTALTLKEQEIDKLKEYKVTLINSAVTGKIKVYSDAK
jgi:type I restriction enzyme S subunit